MDRLQSIETFVCVAECQSFAEAARRMRLSRSVVSARIQQLEEYLGGPLFHRTTRSVRLSELGEAFLPDCNALIGNANNMVDQMRHVRSSPTGQFRIHTVPGILLDHLEAVLREFQQQYPDIQLDVTVSDTVIDPVKEGYDCALQIFGPTSDHVVAQPLFAIERVFCASPQYLALHGTPADPRELAGHRLGLYSKYPTRDRWQFHRGTEEVVVHLRATLLSSSVHLLARHAQQHAAIVCLPTVMAEKMIEAGELRRVVAQYDLLPLPLLAVYPRTLRRAYKLQLFLKMLIAASADLPRWQGEPAGAKL